MRMISTHKAVAIIAAEGGCALILHGADPAKAAKLKCKQHLSQVVGRELSDDEVAAMRVTGDEPNGKVQGALLLDNQLHYLACEFENKQTTRTEVDDRVWPDAARYGINRAGGAQPSTGSGDPAL